MMSRNLKISSAIRRWFLFGGAMLLSACCSKSETRTEACEVIGVPLANAEGPYADLHPSLGQVSGIPLRGRLVEEDGPINFDAQRPWDTLTQDEIPEAHLKLVLVTDEVDTCIALPSVRVDAEGYSDGIVALDQVEVPPGEHMLGVFYEDQLVGRTQVRILPPETDQILVRSDVDQTWLDTDFFSTNAQLELLRSDASERDALPAMSRVYRALRSGADGDADRSLIFLSGSPRFFKRVLENKLVRDQVEHEGLVLKPFKDIVLDNIFDLDIPDIIPELKEQIGYKLEALLRFRVEVPATAPEILMGDDTEADVVAYTLYHRFTSGTLDAEALDGELANLQVAESWREAIAQAAPKVTAHLEGAPAPVRAIYINRTAYTSSHYDVADYAIEGIVRYHSGAWPLMLDLYEDGLVSSEAVTAVRDELMNGGQSAETLAEAAAAGEADGFLSGSTQMQFE